METKVCRVVGNETAVILDSTVKISSALLAHRHPGPGVQPLEVPPSEGEDLREVAGSIATICAPDPTGHFSIPFGVPY